MVNIVPYNVAFLIILLALFILSLGIVALSIPKKAKKVRVVVTVIELKLISLPISSEYKLFKSMKKTPIIPTKMIGITFNTTVIF